MPQARSVVVAGRTAPRGAYPHLKVVGDVVFVSGTSARRPDGAIEGAEVGADGRVSRDIRVQTRAVLDNIAALLDAVGLSLADLVDVTSFLVTMDDFEGVQRGVRASTSRPTAVRPARRWPSTSCPTPTWPSRSRPSPTPGGRIRRDARPHRPGGLDRGAPGAAASAGRQRADLGRGRLHRHRRGRPQPADGLPRRPLRRVLLPAPGRHGPAGLGGTTAPGTSPSARARCSCCPPTSATRRSGRWPARSGWSSSDPVRPVRWTASSGTAPAAMRSSTAARYSS